ncbi:MAG TPA: Z1 domain-containing protein, partial [Candidatus Acidoferrales bacterium]|nr:Z1 domain-containing protein [Candidatus Acidoferrales bacterium]
MTAGFYARLRDSRQDDEALAACIDRVVKQLEETSTSGDRPGMLLGKIQSGKTRAFVGVIARSFDRGFDIAVVFTKGTKTLSAQTVARLRHDLREFIDEDEVLVFDIMQPPGKLTKSEQRRKLVIVAKKQAKNLERILQFFDTDYPDLKNRKVLIVDDEADLASVRFVRKKDQADVEQDKIAEQMDAMRRLVAKVAYLQVTATPYSLYLQPESYEAEGEDGYVFKPKKPAFTELLPIHAGYVGGDDYFLAPQENDPRSFLIVEVQRDEQDALRREDQRRIRPEKVLDSPNTHGLVRAIITFVLAACLRRWQQAEAGEKKRKYAMVIHNDTQKAAHAWQDQIIEWIFEASAEAASNDPKKLRPLFDSASADLSASIAADKGRVPKADKAFEMFIEALQGGDVVRETVNSDHAVMALLDERAELKLRTPFNIFVGGSILDRGITIPNLIAFYYGRNPRTMQADTVLQHSRMYGNRDRRDLAVTRFYTSRDVYDRLYTINDFENALRSAFESGAHEQGVVFIQSDANNRVRPCAPNKVLLSNVVAVRPTGLYLPTGFQTVSGREITAAGREIDDLIPAGIRDKQKFAEIDRRTALHLI